MTKIASLDKAEPSAITDLSKSTAEALREITRRIEAGERRVISFAITSRVDNGRLIEQVEIELWR